jgi:hypothetical protein
VSLERSLKEVRGIGVGEGTWKLLEDGTSETEANQLESSRSEGTLKCVSVLTATTHEQGEAMEGWKSQETSCIRVGICGGDLVVRHEMGPGA